MKRRVRLALKHDLSVRSLLLLALLPVGLFLNISLAHAAELILAPATAPTNEQTLTTYPDQLPLSRVVHGQKNINAAWFSGPTKRYRHGVLGDDLEAAKLSLETRNGERHVVKLPDNRVFEDLEPRLADLDGDGKEEILVIESDTRLGAALAVYGIVAGQLEKIATTPFIGKANRWLNPVGSGDFDGDGNADIALVATPHIGGILRLYRLQKERLVLFAERTGISTHQIGSTELGLSRVIPSHPRDMLLVPNQNRNTLLLLEWSETGWHEHARLELPGELSSALQPIGDNRWRIRLDSGNYYEIGLHPNRNKF